MKSLTLALGDEVSVCSLASSWSIVRLAQGAGVVRGVGAACVSTVTDLRTHFMCVVCVCECVCGSRDMRECEWCVCDSNSVMVRKNSR